MIATTFEQSKSLIRAGIKPSTADMCYQSYEFTMKVKVGGGIELDNLQAFGMAVGNPWQDYPAWSLGALWKLCRELAISIHFHTAVDTVEEMFQFIVDRIVETFPEGCYRLDPSEELNGGLIELQ